MCSALPSSPLTWRELHFPRPMDVAQAVEKIQTLTTDPFSPLVVLEARGSAGAVPFLVGCEQPAVTRVVSALGAVAVGLSMPRTPVLAARKLQVTNRQRALNTEALAATAPAILSALAACENGEELILQVVLGPRLSGLVVPNDATRPVPVHRLLVGGGTRMDAESRTALVKKVCEPGFAAVVRIGVSAKTPTRRQALVMGLLGGLRRLQSPGVAIFLANEKPERFDAAKAPWRWPLRLNVSEVAALSALPVGNELPGLPSLHPFPKAPVVGPFLPSAHRIVVAKVTTLGVTGLPDQHGRPTTPYLTRSTDALVRHTHVIGPTGVGKSVLLANMTLADIGAGRGAVVIEPKGDLIDDILARVPEHRRDDVVVLDPSCENVVGLNPLAGTGSPELRADMVMSIFADIYAEALGVRSTDILHASLLTLLRGKRPTLMQVPRLLTDPGFRASLVAKVAGDPALGPFWAWYDSLAPTQQMTVIAPLMNKWRGVVMKSSVRAVLGQVEPKFDIRDVFRANKILLVPLPVATLGAEGSALLGSLVVSQLWDAARERATVPMNLRKPVSIVLDECQQFMRLPTDLADALATSRGYGVGWTLAHQYLSQLPPAMRSAALTNCRSRIVFQTTRDDAKVFAAETGDDLEPGDFTSLPAFHVYASMVEQGSVQPYASGATLPLAKPSTDGSALRRASGERYGRPVAEVEAEFAVTPAANMTVEPVSEDAGSDGRRRRGGSS